MARSRDKEDKKSGRVGSSTDDFMNSVKSMGATGIYLNIKKMDPSKVIGFIHPTIGFAKRSIHKSSIPAKVEKDGEVLIKRRRFNCAGKDVCPVCKLVKFAEQAIDDGRDEDINVLDGGKKGGGKWTLGALAGRSDNFKYDLSVADEFIFPIVQRTEDRDDDYPVQIMTGPPSMGLNIKKVITSKIEDLGSKKGDPLKTPYPCKFTYDKEGSFTDKYPVEWVGSDVAPLDDETREILKLDADDLEDIVDIVESMVRPGHVGDMMNAIESCWVCKDIAFEEFEEFVGGIEQEEDDPKKDDEDPDFGDDDDNKSNDDKPKKVMCPECKVLVTPNKKGRCPDCSSKLPKKSDKVKCPDCGKMVKPDKKDRCPNCRAKLDSDIPFN